MNTPLEFAFHFFHSSNVVNNVRNLLNDGITPDAETMYDFVEEEIFATDCAEANDYELYRPISEAIWKLVEDDEFMTNYFNIVRK